MADADLMIPMSPAERRILDEVGLGEIVNLGGLPEAGDESRRVRAGFLRALIVGSEPGCAGHEKGVRVQGAWVTGTLDLEGCRVERDIGLFDCRFDGAPLVRSAKLDGLFLNRSQLPGLRADRLETRGGVFLRGAMVRGEARLLGARIGGNLSCSGAVFERLDGVALSADGLDARGGVFLSGATVRGEARLLGARIGRDLSCDDAVFERLDGVALNADQLDAHGSVFLRGATIRGGARLLGARIGGDLALSDVTLDRPNGDALDASGARIGGGLFLRRRSVIRGRLTLIDAEIGRINDDPACWPATGDLDLNRCRYGAFTGPAPTDAVSRLDWLSRQDPARRGADFQPQPYVHLAKVLREMGHEADARRVLIEKEQLQRRAERAALEARQRGARLRLAVETVSDANRAAVDAAVQARHDGLHKNDPRRRLIDAELGKARPRRRIGPAARADVGLVIERLGEARVDPALAARAPLAGLWWLLLYRRIVDALMGAVIGYGHHPARAVLWALPFVVSGWLVYGWAYAHGAMQPGAALWLRSAEWRDCAGVIDRAQCFLHKPDAAAHPRMNALAYSVDVFLPVFDLDQQAHWRPAAEAPGGWWVRAFQWGQITAGWALSLLAIAGFSGIVKKD